MNHLITNIQKLDITPILDHKYDFIDFLNIHYNTQCIYNILNSIEEYKLKNIYNKLVIQWSIIIERLDYPARYKHYKLKINNKGIMYHDVFNSLLDKFINNNKIIGIFVINTILHFIQ